MPAAEIATVRVCPNCGFSHLRSSRPHSVLERAQAWWSGTGWFRCETCRWRGRLRDVWDPDAAFPDLPPLRLGRDLDIEFLQQRDEESLVELVLSRKDDLKGVLKVWLDDSRPAPPGWLRVTTVANAKRLLEADLVSEISLDYDLGWCAECLSRGDHLKRSGQRHCPHTPTGYDLVEWMSNSNHWPRCPPIVHSGNMEGGARMLGVIARRWREPQTASTATAAPPPGAPGSNGPEPASNGGFASHPSHQRPGPASAGDAPGRMKDSSTVTTLTTCPRCGGTSVYRMHRRSNMERFVSLMIRRYPVRCDACGWTQWSKSPILVRLSPGADTPTERIETERIEQMDD